MDSNTGSQTLYGRACMSCSKSKCRCVRHPGRDGCERCHRLKKQCQPSEPVRKRNTDKSSASRISHLEGRLNDLTSLLQSIAPSSTGGLVSSSVDQLLGPNSMVSGSSPGGGGVATASSTAHTPVSSTSASSWSSTNHPMELPYEEAEKYLDIFRTHMLKSFAFIHLPQDMSAKTLQQQRPFLYKCIMAVSYPSPEIKLAFFKDIKQILAQRMILENDSNLHIDLLLGLLTYLAWGNEALLTNNPTILSRFTYLAVTIVFELRLSKPLPEETNMLPTMTERENSIRRSFARRTLEERRAVLGCYLMSASIASFKSQIDVLQWTTYMDECLEVLMERKESPLDELFVNQVRLQLLSQRMSQATWPHGQVEHSGNTVPPGFYLQALRSNLQQIKGDLPLQLQTDKILLASLYYAELSIYEVALSKEPITTNSFGFQRLECLYACLATIKAAFDNFFSISLSEYFGISFPCFVQLARYVVVLYKLSTLEDPAWDTNLARSTVDIFSILDQLLSNLEQANRISFDGSEDNVIGKTIKVFLSVRTWCSMKFATGTNDTGFQLTGEGGILPEPIPFAGMDDVWLRDFLPWSD